MYGTAITLLFEGVECWLIARVGFAAARPLVGPKRLFRLQVRGEAIRLLKRAFEAWPYVFLAVSVAGLAYVFMNAGR